jgi:hypothetical protein
LYCDNEGRRNDLIQNKLGRFNDRDVGWTGFLRLGIEDSLIDADRPSLPAMTVILDRLESLGFVTRQRDAKDRRRYSVVAVPEQVKRVDAMYRKRSQKMAALLET